MAISSTIKIKVTKYAKELGDPNKCSLIKTEEKGQRDKIVCYFFPKLGQVKDEKEKKEMEDDLKELIKGKKVDKKNVAYSMYVDSSLLNKEMYVWYEYYRTAKDGPIYSEELKNEYAKLK